MGGASVEAALVMTTGWAKTAVAPWKLLPVGQQTSSCVTVKGCASVEYVYVSHHTQARPVRSALFVRAVVSSTWSAWSVGCSGQEQRRTGENWLLLMQGG